MIGRIVLSLALVTTVAEASPPALGALTLGEFRSAPEISGIARLPDGRLIGVGDEDVAPFFLFSLREDGTIDEKSIGHDQLAAAGGRDAARLDDLEAVAVDAGGRVWATTSHSRAASGKDKKHRDKLVRFELEGDRVVRLVLAKDLKRRLVASRPELAPSMNVTDVKNRNGFNIEGLAFDGSGRQLVIGLRGPIVDGKAVLLRIDNPDALFADAEAKLDVTSVALALGGDGIRGLDWNSRLAAYVVVSGSAQQDSGVNRLWRWSGSAEEAPREIAILDPKTLDHAEGVTSIRHQGVEKLLIVGDGKPGRWAILGDAVSPR